MEHLKPLTTGEENLMKVIWDSHKIYLKDILSAYPEPKPHQNTISTFLMRSVILQGRNIFSKPPRFQHLFLTLHRMIQNQMG